jgi:SAM-dependent methyltransferase
MISFTCNICGTANTTEVVPWEPSSCSGCRSNVRMRAIVHLLSAALFGEERALPDFPVDREVKGIGLSDENCYAVPLAKKFDYTNTFFDHDPFLDITETHPELYGTYDFILSSDVFEHIAPPIERAFAEALALLKPNGTLCMTVPSVPGDVNTVEYYPDLHAYSIVEVGGEHVLINRKRDGSIEVHQNLEFHGGPGATLVMRQFSQKDLAPRLRAAGFADVTLLSQNVESEGIFLAGPWGHPLMARKGRYELPAESIPEQAAEVPAAPDAVNALEDRILQSHKDKENLERRIAALESQLRVTFDSRWLKLGKRLGLGPKLR